MRKGRNEHPMQIRIQKSNHSTILFVAIVFFCVSVPQLLQVLI